MSVITYRTAEVVPVICCKSVNETCAGIESTSLIETAVTYRSDKTHNKRYIILRKLLDDTLVCVGLCINCLVA